MEYLQKSTDYEWNLKQYGSCMEYQRISMDYAWILVYNIYRFWVGCRGISIDYAWNIVEYLSTNATCHGISMDYARNIDIRLDL